MLPTGYELTEHYLLYPSTQTNDKLYYVYLFIQQDNIHLSHVSTPNSLLRSSSSQWIHQVECKQKVAEQNLDGRVIHSVHTMVVQITICFLKRIVAVLSRSLVDSSDGLRPICFALRPRLRLVLSERQVSAISVSFGENIPV